MKQTRFLLAALLLSGMSCHAQEVTTYSVYDTNQSGDVTVSDVTEVVNNVKRNVAATSTQQYVTADELAKLLKTLTDKIQLNADDLKLIKSKLEIGDTPGAPQQYASFEYASKNLKVGDTFTQTVTSISDGAVTYVSNNPSVATVDASSGQVTAVATGEAIITAVIASTSSYGALSASYTVKVEESNMMNGHEYVDLGLSVKWAKCNIGAENIYDYGDYFAWGETSGYNSGKTKFSWDTYKYYKSETRKETDADGFETSTDISGVTKYAESFNPGYDGFYDDKTTLELADDAANVNWGGEWRMPTMAEQDELRTKCTRTWVTLNGVKGYKVVASNGNYIFLPAAGCLCDGYLYGAGSNGSYWSSSLSSSLSGGAYGFYFRSGSVNWGNDSDGRYYGYSVRAVCQ